MVTETPQSRAIVASLIGHCERMRYRIAVVDSAKGQTISEVRALRSQISSALQIIVQARRLTGGRRKVVSVSEITGMEGEQIQMHDLFAFEQSGVDGEGHAVGRFISTGIRPRCAERIEHRAAVVAADAVGVLQIQHRITRAAQREELTNDP